MTKNSWYLLLTVLVLCPRCTQDWNNPYDSVYKGDYCERLILPKDESFYAFTMYNIEMEHIGADKYESYSVFTIPDGKIDTFLFRGSSDTLLILYFTSAFSGRLGIRCLRPNGKEDTLLYTVSVMQPLFIHHFDDQYQLTAPEETSSALENIKTVMWYADHREYSEYAVSDTFSYEGTSGIYALCKDWFGNSLKVEFTGETILDSISHQFMYKTGDSVGFLLYLHSSSEDSGVIQYIAGSDTSETVVKVDSETLSVELNQAALASGYHRISFIYKSSNSGIYSNKLQTEVLVCDSMYYAKINNTSEELISGKDLAFDCHVTTALGYQAPSGIYKWQILLGSDTIFNNFEHDLKRVSFQTEREGLLTVRVVYTDLYGNSSPVATFGGYVQDSNGKLLDGIFVRPYPVYSGQKITLVVPATVSAGSVCKWSFDSDTVWECSSPLKSVEHVFTDSGIQIVNVKHISQSGSQSYACTIQVLDGRPQIDSIAIIDTLYSTSELQGVVYASDPANVGIREYRVKLISGEKQQEYSSSQPVLSIFTGTTGICTLTVKLEGKSGLTSELYSRLVTIADGSPRWKAFGGLDEAWLNEKYTVHVECSDIDGIVKKVVIDWGDGNIDTVSIEGRSVQCQVQHVFTQIAPQGFFQISASVFDNTMAVSELKSYKVTIRDGRPQVSICSSVFSFNGDTVRTIAKNDTLVVPYLEPEYIDGKNLLQIPISLISHGERNQVLLYGVSCGSADTIQESDWMGKSSLWYSTTSVSRLSASSDPMVFTAFCKDNAGMIGKKEFLLRTDASPVRPVVSVNKGVAENQYVISWTGGNDLRDGLNTEIQIRHMISYGNQFGSSVFVDTILATNRLLNLSYSGGQYSYNVLIEDEYYWASNEIIITAVDQLGNRNSGKCLFSR